MTFSPIPKRPHDRPVITLLEPSEIREWCNYFGATEAELRLAMRAVGDKQDGVRDYLLTPPECAQGKAMTEDPSDPLTVFHQLAAQAGLIAANELLSAQMLGFAMLIFDRCAAIVDAYGDAESGGNAGERMRAELYG